MQKQSSNQQQTLQQLHHLKRLRIPNYPHYPLTDSLSQKGMGFLFGVDISISEIFIVIQPLKNQQTLQAQTIIMEDIPRKFMSCLKILEFKWQMRSQYSIKIDNLEFIVGFLSGFLVKCNFNGKKFRVLQKFNRKPNPKQGLMMRMSSMLFGSDSWYQVSLQKSIMNIRTYSSQNLKYKYSYQIGNRIMFYTSLISQDQADLLRIFTELQWQHIKAPSLRKHAGIKAITIKQSNLKAMIRQKQMLIEFQQQIPTSYVYSQRGLFVINNIQNKIILYNMENMERQLVYKVDEDIRRINLCQFRQKQYLIVMPSNNYIFIINLDQNCVSLFMGHKSFIANSFITKRGHLLTAGCDHRVAIKSLNKIAKWIPIQPYKLKEDPEKMSKIRKKIQLQNQYTKYYEIETNKLDKQKMGQSYFFGQFNNINRNNNNQYGFGDMMHIHEELYAFLTYDSMMKVYKIRV